MSGNIVAQISATSNIQACTQPKSKCNACTKKLSNMFGASCLLEFRSFVDRCSAEWLCREHLVDPVLIYFHLFSLSTGSWCGTVHWEEVKSLRFSISLHCVWRSVCHVISNGKDFWKIQNVFLNKNALASRVCWHATLCTQIESSLKARA